MPTPSITITSTDIPLNGLIPPLNKGNVVCGEANISPAIAWSYDNGLFEAHLESIEIHITQDDITGIGYNGLLTHWSVTNIAPSITSIGQDITWNASEIINPTSIPTGDLPNGYNGPCALNTGGAGQYTLWIVGIIKPQYYDYFEKIIPFSTFVRVSHAFLDDIQNTSVPETSGDCGTGGCPEGFTLIGDMCQQISSTSYTINETVYQTAKADGNVAYGDKGMRIYQPIDNYIFPLRSDVLGNLFDDGGTGIAVTKNAASPVTSSPWDNDGGIVKGRLNYSGVWTGLCGPCAPFEVSLPNFEWIGFSRCITVPETKIYSIGFSADNNMRLSINGVKVVECLNGGSELFKYWNVVPFTLSQGENIIELEARNQGGVAAFGAEIYNADAATLIGLGSPAALEPYILFSTKDGMGQNFDIGENSGFTCPGGYAYDACTPAECTSIEYIEPTPIECCWLIESCLDETETYLIKFDPAETAGLYGNNVYTLASPFGEGILTQRVNGQTVAVCFILVEQVVCKQADVTDVSVINDFGTNACVACTPSKQFASCIDGSFIYIDLIEGSPSLVVGNIYKLNGFSECYAFAKVNTQIAPTVTDVIIADDYGTADCQVCVPRLGFRNCVTNSKLFVLLADGEIDPSVGEVVTLGGDPAIENQCWYFTNYTETTEDYIDVTIESTTSCTSCNVCNIRYQITDCLDPLNIKEIIWNQSETPLDESLSYVFAFDSETCWSVSFLPPDDCETAQSVPPSEILTAADIINTYADCETCGAVCYKLIDCDGYMTVSTTDLSFLSYVGKIIKWTDPTEVPSPVERCARVEKYTCREETYPQPTITVIDCYDDCVKCNFVEPRTEEELKTGRDVEPGYDVPDCVTPNTSSCE